MSNRRHSTPSEEDFSSGTRFDLWHKVFIYCRPYLWQLISLVVIMLVFATLDAVIPFMIGYAIDHFVVPHSTDGLDLFVLAVVAIALIRGCSVWIMIITGGRINTWISYDIRRDAFNHLQHLSFSYFDKRPVGWLMSRLTSDCSTLAATLSWGLVDVVDGFSRMIIMISVMLYFDWKITLVVLAVLPILFVISLFFRRLILEGFRKVRSVSSEVTGAINEGISGAETTKTLVREEANLDEFMELTDEMSRVSVSAAMRSSMYLPIVLLIGSVGTALALWQGGTGVMNGTVQYGVLVMFISYTTRFFQPVQDLARRFSEFQNAQAAAERVFSLMETTPAVGDGDKMLIDPPEFFRGEVDFENVSFHYKEEEPVLSDFNLRVRSGETVAVVGETGAGKTTVTSLLARFYEPVSGTIKYDGIDYTQLPLKWVHQRLGVVLQTPHLFHGSVRENIRYGRLEATDEEIRAAAELVNADHFINKLEDRYDFIIGEGGSGLSVGQKQLLTFARAIISEPEIFILDEATASIDTETERLIQDAISRVQQQCTCIVVAHRLSTIRSADRIIVMNKGRIVEQGNHAELIAARGSYYQLYTTQYMEQQENELLTRPK